MAVTQDSFTGNGTKTDYDFTFPYLKQSEVKASLDGTATTNIRFLTATKIQFVNNTTANTPTAPASGVKIKIFRETEADSLAATFYAGSSIKSEDLNDNFTQNLYAVQEVTERYLSNLGGTLTGNLNLGEDVILKFEGATNNAHETILTVVDPTADRTITLPNVTGTVITTGDTGTVATGMIANDAINGTKITDDAVDSEHIVADSLDTEHYAPASIDAAALASDSVITAKILDLNVTRAKIANDAIDGTKLADNSVDSEHYVDGSIDTAHIGNDQVTADKLANTSVTAGTYTAVDITVDAQGRITSAASGTIARSEIAADAIDGSKIDDDAIDSEHIAAGALDAEHYSSGSIDSTKLNPATVITNAEQSSATGNDTSFFTTAASDARYFNVSTGDTIKDGDAFPDNDTTIATTAAINDRIVDLVDDVGGFVPIANETSFPNANPDVNDGTGTLVSIKALASNLTSNGSGVATIANGTVGNSTVTITGLANSTTYAATFGMIVETTTTLNTYTFHRQVPKATEVTTVAGSITNINAVASNHNNINSVAASLSGTQSYAVTVANVGGSNYFFIDSVQAPALNLIKGFTYTFDVSASSNSGHPLRFKDGSGNSYTTGVTTSGTEGQTGATVTLDVASDAPSSLRYYCTAHGNGMGNTIATADSNIGKVAGSITNVNTVAGAISNVNTVATNINDVNNFADLYQVSSSAPSTDGGGNSLAVGDLWFDSSSNKVLKVHDGTGFKNTSPTQSVLDDISIVSGSLTRQEDLGSIADAISTGSSTGALDTCATNITNVNTFANVYRISASAPSSSLDEGDLWYDSTANVLKYYNGTIWTVTAAAGLSNVSEDTTPELGGHLDCNDKNLTEVGTVSGNNLQIDFGTLT